MWPSLAAITALQILSILSTRDWMLTEDSSAQFSCKSCPRWTTLLCCLALTFWSSSSHTSSLGFKSTLYTRHQLKDMLFLFAFNVLLTEFTSMLWVIILYKYKSLIHKLHSKWNCVMLPYAVISLHLVQIPNFAFGENLLLHNTASSMLYSWCDTGGCRSLTNSSLHINPPIWPQNFKLPLLYCPVFVCFEPLEPFDIVLHPQLWFLDINSAI